MTKEERDKVFAICCASKRGQHVSSDSLEYCAKMAKKYPQEYKALGREVFEATKPFGAN